MIDLAALTQAVDEWDKGFRNSERIGPVVDAARLVSRLWQPCQNCDGDGRWAQCHEYHGPCPVCGGVGVEPTPQAVEALYQAVFSPRDNTRPAMEAGLMALWRVANEETD